MEQNVPVPQPRIARFERLGFGMFIHWGLYSQLGKGEWIQKIGSIPQGEYTRLMDTFTAEHFDAREIAGIAKRAGMNYITFTTRHHDGFSLYDTRGLNRYDSMHSPAKRDFVADLIAACREEGLLPVLYHTTLDWYEPSFERDFDAYLDYLYRSVEILCTQYGPIGGLWFDGNWSRPDADWKLNELYGMIRRHQPEALIINNTGLSHRGELGHPEIDSVTFEQGRPKPMDRSGMSKYVAAEMCETINDHWGIGAGDFMYKSVPHLIESLCACRKAGANYLLNVGPTAEGRILTLQQAMLETLGQWFAVNGKPIYEGKPAEAEGEGSNFALETTDGKLYLFIHHLKISGHAAVTVEGGGPGEKTFTGLRREVESVRWLDNGEELEFTQETAAGTFRFKATGFPYGVNYVVRVAEVTLKP
ncbi:alpha-L-fucosidase [Paenibacillus ginsengarvi]|uniref:alpha-L-fucosidase n=1 Tax=Paenibacillus ginsengarvi TaxID=400777 RepID=A0A3B0C592_9BACL|nr:alpha-L-fucosidase [Paenibacillus ginsengarvi]RKN79199.1 alpha-L-fucosidase [Paenibacillus ginsengarvi]